MSDRRELGFPKRSASSLREQLARTTLQTLRSQGHTYVDLREDGKRFVFFCTLCLAPCYSDSVLLDHLKGNLHKERLSTASATLFGPNPWPFDDGVYFFDASSRNDENLAIMDGSQQKLLEHHCDDNNLAIITYDENLQGGPDGSKGSNGVNHSSAESMNGDEMASELVVPSVLFQGKLVDVRVKFTGLGQISASFVEKDGNTDEISRIWCEWLGRNGIVGEDVADTPEHDFAVVTFAYYYELGILDDAKYLLTFGPAGHDRSWGDSKKRKRSISEPEDAGEFLNTFVLAEHDQGDQGNYCRKRKRSFSEPEDVGEFLNYNYDSSEEGSTASNAALSRLLVYQNDDQLLRTRFISNKTIRRELRRRQRVLAERMCDICQQKMLPGKDVSAIMNLKTGKFVCSSRNTTGAFHVFHTSCLIHWLLFCELEVSGKQSVSSKQRPNARKKPVAKTNGKGKKRVTKCMNSSISSVFCPQCQGTGARLESDQLERDKVPLSQMFRYKIKVSDARKAWLRSPEKLQNCSTGLHFPYRFGGSVQEKVSALKMLRFYRADC